MSWRERSMLTSAVVATIFALIVVVPASCPFPALAQDSQGKPRNTNSTSQTPLLASSRDTFRGRSSSEPTKVAQDLKLIRNKLERETRRLDELKKEETTLRKSEDELRIEAARLENSERETKNIVESLGKEIVVRELQTAQAEKDLELEQARFRRRLVALYKVHHRNSQLLYIAEAHSLSELLRRSRYVSAIAEGDKIRVATLDDLGQRLRNERELLTTKQVERQSALAEIMRLSREVGKRREEKARLVRAAERKKELQEQSLTQLEQSAAELERVLAEIMGSAEPESDAPAPERRIDDKSKPKEATTVARVESSRPEQTRLPGVPSIAAPYNGPGLASLSGKLAAPVTGTVLQRFGKQKHEEFSDILFVKGLEFSSTVGARVKPVAKGKVILSQRLPGFGNVVIVDHCSRYYTLYGRLASVLAQSGDVVSSGDVIGILGEPDFRGRNFYFELRHKGKAIDPKAYFASGALASS